MLNKMWQNDKKKGYCTNQGVGFLVFSNMFLQPMQYKVTLKGSKFSEAGSVQVGKMRLQ